MIDAHGHLEDRQFDKDREEIFSNLKSDGIDYFFNCGSNLETSRESVEFSNRYDNVYAIVGIHPLDADEFCSDALDEIKKLAIENKKVVAIGEIGLDNHYENCPSPDAQREAFFAQLDLAEELNLPVVIHSREAAEETYNILKERKLKDPNFSCVLHCYSGDVELMKKYVDLGFYFTLGGFTTFKKSFETQEVAKAIPLDKLMLETDCPYMTPVPFRGKRNQPKYVIHTAEFIANLRGITFEEIEKATDENVARFYNLKL